MNYKDLTVWDKSMKLTILVYQYTRKFPPEERYGLVSQMRRAAVSIPSNIAEGSRRSLKSQRHFLQIAFGSGSELETQIEIAKRLSYVTQKEFVHLYSLLEEVMKMLNGMLKKIAT